MRLCLHVSLQQSWDKQELFHGSCHQRSCCMHAYSVNPHPTPLPTLKREVQLVDHLNNALNNSTVIAAKKATIGLEADQQSARRNSKFSISAAENAASICMTNGTFVQGREGLPRLRGDTSWEGRCHAAIGQPGTLQHSQHGMVHNGEGKKCPGHTGSARDGDAGLNMQLCQNIMRIEGNQQQDKVT